jgi:hypothetical protein
MAKKTRKQKQRAAARRQPAIPGAAGLSAPALADDDGDDLVTAVGSDDPAVGSADPAAGSSDPVVVDPAADSPALAELPFVPAPQQAAIPPPPAGRRRVERLNAPAAALPRSSRIPANAATMFAPLESEDAAIPFDRVPYVRADLRRVAIMASVMVVLIIIAAIVVSHVVK